MKLSEIVSTFKEKKERIRKKMLSEESPIFKNRGIEMAIEYSEAIESATKNLFNFTKENLNHRGNGIAAFLYESPGRKEMVSESDLDIMLVYKNNSNEYKNFKEKFQYFAKPFEFCKIDLPVWGTLEEAKIFAQKSITEGNQVLESNFIIGDSSIKKDMDKIQNKFGGPERMIRNIVFQKFYFEQYFKQRIRNGAINIKYCDGGSRDYLFIHWFNQLMKKKYPNWDNSNKERPVAEQGISNLYNQGLINKKEFTNAIDALDFNLIFRNEILIANKGTPDEGLTFLDEKTLNNVFYSVPNLMKRYPINSPKKLSTFFDEQRFKIANIKENIWNLMIYENGKEKKDPFWSRNFHNSYFPTTSEKERKNLLGHNDILMDIAAIWGASKSHQTKLFEYFCDAEKNSDSWEIQASLATSPHCPPEYLHHLATTIGKNLGYGYVLRIVSRNPNVKKETLESIANDSKVEPRYTQCAKAALKDGKGSANHQI